MSNAVADATKALDIIKDTAGHGYLPYFVNPNALLGLGHMRGMSDVKFDMPTDEDKTNINRIADAINQSENDYYCVTNEGKLAFDDTPYIMVDIYSRRALGRLHECKLMPLPELPDESLETTKSYIEKLETNTRLPAQRKAHQDPMNNLALQWTIGLLYGYPEPAVAAMPPFWEYGYEGEEFHQRVLEAKIEHMYDYFETSAGICAYDYPWFLSEHPDITGHQQLWSDYFEEFYNSQWHHDASRQTDFQATMQAAHKYKEEQTRRLNE